MTLCCVCASCNCKSLQVSAATKQLASCGEPTLTSVFVSQTGVAAHILLEEMGRCAEGEERRALEMTTRHLLKAHALKALSFVTGRGGNPTLSTKSGLNSASAASPARTRRPQPRPLLQAPAQTWTRRQTQTLALPLQAARSV
jgi:hypothetical protein